MCHVRVGADEARRGPAALPYLLPDHAHPGTQTPTPPTHHLSSTCPLHRPVHTGAHLPFHADPQLGFPQPPPSLPAASSRQPVLPPLDSLLPLGTVASSGSPQLLQRPARRLSRVTESCRGRSGPRTGGRRERWQQREGRGAEAAAGGGARAGGGSPGPGPRAQPEPAPPPSVTEPA